MKKHLIETLLEWPYPYIRDSDFAILLNKTENARYSFIKRATHEGLLTHLCRGHYLIKYRYHQNPVDAFQLAQFIYGPSYISLESALSFHGWIPEAVQTTTSVVAKRSKEFLTPLGSFSYKHTPLHKFFMEVQRYSPTKSCCYLIANPWKAIADYIYTTHKEWNNAQELSEDLRIDMELMSQSDKSSLEQIISTYSNQRTKNILQRLLQTLPPRNS
mgnify:CR=1 FL=1